MYPFKLIMKSILETIFNTLSSYLFLIFWKHYHTITGFLLHHPQLSDYGFNVWNLGISQSTLHSLPHHVLSILMFQMILKLPFLNLSVIILFRILLPQSCLLIILNGLMMASNWMMTNANTLMVWKWMIVLLTLILLNLYQHPNQIQRNEKHQTG